jgi:hypothetical protein
MYGMTARPCGSAPTLTVIRARLRELYRRRDNLAALIRVLEEVSSGSGRSLRHSCEPASHGATRTSLPACP